MRLGVPLSKLWKGKEDVNETDARRYAALMALVARLEALKTERDGMNSSGGYSDESYLEISHRMEDIAEQLEAMS